MPRRKYVYAQNKPRPRNKLTLEQDTYEVFLEAKDRFIDDLRERHTIKLDAKNPISWSSFLQQAVLFMEAGRHLPTVQAQRYNRYGWFAVCPNCGKEHASLVGKTEIIWKITCLECNCDYIATA